MFRKIIELIRQAIRRMVQYEDLSETIRDKEIYTVSEDMIHALQLWEDMYEDKSPWLNETNGIYSLGIAPFICASMTTNMMNEFKSIIVDPADINEVVDESRESDRGTRSSYLNETYHRNLLSTLNDHLEHALAVGGMVIKPYVNNGSVYYSYCMQGEFVPLSFTDDGIIDDIAFYDDFIDQDKRYRRVERHVFNVEDNTDTIINTAYVADIVDITEKGVQLGNPIQLKDVPRWAEIEEETVINDVEKPLYGYFKVAKANNIDSNSPLGISIFSRATSMIHRADVQFSRLDWEYEGGQMAVDVDLSATRHDESGNWWVDQTRNRLYRKIDVGSDDTYNVFAPTLRDNQYIDGLNNYLMRIEDLCEVSRGTISTVQAEARTATELEILQQRTYSNITRNQRALEKCLDDVIYATDVLVSLYGLAKDGEYTTTHEWSDSILVDTAAELDQRLLLVNAKVLSKAEVRAWYCGENIDVAKHKVDEIQEELNDEQMKLNDLFSAGDGNKVEPSGKEGTDNDTSPTEPNETENIPKGNA